MDNQTEWDEKSSIVKEEYAKINQKMCETIIDLESKIDELIVANDKLVKDKSEQKMNLERNVDELKRNENFFNDLLVEKDVQLMEATDICAFHNHENKKLNKDLDNAQDRIEKLKTELFRQKNNTDMNIEKSEEALIEMKTQNAINQNYNNSKDSLIGLLFLFLIIQSYLF